MSVHFLVSDHSELKQEVRFKRGVQKHLGETFAKWICTPGVNSRSDAFGARIYNFFDFGLLNLGLLSKKVALRKTCVAPDIF